MDGIVDVLERVLGGRPEPESPTNAHAPRRISPRHARATFVPVSDPLLARWLAH